MAGEYEWLNRFHVVAQTGYPKTTVIVDSAGGGDYTTIKAAVAGVSPTVTAPVKIFVRNGSYNEIQIIGKDYLDIGGESAGGVIVICDGLRTDTDPISGLPYNEMDQDDKSCLFIYHTMRISNLTIRANDVKYCSHNDAGSAYRCVFDNVIFEHANGFPVGCGCRENQIIEFVNCTFEKMAENVVSGNGSHGIFWHNWNNQSGATRLMINRCQFINCGIAYLYELGSDYTDLVTIDRCSTDDTKEIFFAVTDNYWNGGGQGLTNVPYCINVLSFGGPYALDYVSDNRPSLLDHVSQE